MKKTTLLFYFILLLRMTSAQQIYQVDTVDDGITKSIRLKIPSHVDDVKGLLIMGNPWQGGVLNFVDDSMAIAFAESIDFAVMGTSLWGRFKEAEEFVLFEHCIDSLARMSGHPEISNAPVIIFGCSNGGQMAHSYNSLRPEKCIAFLVDKGGYYINPLPDTLALKTPGMLVAGEFDLPYRVEAINELFYNNRPRGALWSHIVYQGTGHSLIRETHNLFFVLAEAAHQLRYPTDQSPINGPVTLKNLNQSEGWLSDSTSWNSGIISVFNQADYTGKVDSASWHINKDLAFLFAAHSSYNRQDKKAYVSKSIADSGDMVSYHFEPGLTWDSIHLFNKSEQIGAYYGCGISAIDIELTMKETGFNAFFAKIYLSTGDSSVANPDFVFVRKLGEPNSIGNEIAPFTQDKSYTLYPNPSTGLVNISFENAERRFIEIWDLSGKEITKMNSSNLHTQFNIKGKGIFLVKIKEGEQVFSERVVVK